MSKIVAVFIFCSASLTDFTFASFSALRLDLASKSTFAFSGIFLSSSWASSFFSSSFKSSSGSPFFSSSASADFLSLIDYSSSVVSPLSKMAEKSFLTALPSILWIIRRRAGSSSHTFGRFLQKSVSTSCRTRLSRSVFMRSLNLRPILLNSQTGKQACVNQKSKPCDTRSLKKTVESYIRIVFILAITSSVLFDLSVSLRIPKSASLSSISAGIESFPISRLWNSLCSFVIAFFAASES